MRFKGWMAGIAAAALGTAVAVGPDVQAGKPGGGGGVPLDGGTLWQADAPPTVMADPRYPPPPWTLESAQPSGSGLTAHPVGNVSFPAGEAPDVTHDLHGGVRWIYHNSSDAASRLGLRRVDGTGTSSSIPAAFAPRFRNDPATGAKDAYLTWAADRQDPGAVSLASGSSWGLWQASIDWSRAASGDAGVFSTPVLLFDIGSTRGRVDHEWTDAGTTVVYDAADATTLRVYRRSSADGFAAAADLGEGWYPVLSAGASPRIAYLPDYRVASIWTMNLDGTGRTQFPFPATSEAVFSHRWSPAGSWLAVTTSKSVKKGVGLQTLWTTKLVSADGSTTRTYTDTAIIDWRP